MAAKQPAKSKPTPKSTTSSRKRAAILGLGLLALVLLVVQFEINRNLMQRMHLAENATIKSLIVDAVMQLGRPAAVDPQTGQQYLSFSRLVLPADSTVPPLRYQVGDANETVVSNSNTLHLAAAKVTSGQSLNEIFKHVPSLQACSRQYVLRYAEQEADGDIELRHTKTLSNGKTLYIYENPSCKAGGSHTLESLKLIDSY